jgi:uncharacterized protein
MAQASRAFQVFAKPAGAVCNLDCRYCYYLDKQALYAGPAPFRMSDDRLEAYIVRHIEASQSPVIDFSWHGGEPTVLGVDYFRRVVALQRKHLPVGRRISNGMQTNGVLLDEEWCGFFSEAGFRVGLSLDGPAELHDPYRVTRGHEPTHAKVMRALDLLQRRRVPHDILCVVHDRNVRHPTHVYRFFKKIGAMYLGFLPVVEPDPRAERGVSAHSVTAEAYGEFLCTIFDEWLERDVGRVAVQMFEEVVRPAQGLQHSLCLYRETCGDVVVVEHNGDVYSCDHFVDEAHRLGNLCDAPLAELLESPAQVAFGEAKRDALPRFCLDCEVRPLCNGGCPKDRFIHTPDGEPGLNYLCAGLKRFFVHALPYVVQVASERAAGPSVKPLLAHAPGDGPEAFPGAGRNDPCPCGSGKKYKKCCLET